MLYRFFNDSMLYNICKLIFINKLFYIFMEKLFLQRFYWVRCIKIRKLLSTNGLICRRPIAQLTCPFIMFVCNFIRIN